MLTGASAVSIAGANTTGWSNYGFDFTIWSILLHWKCLARKITFAWFLINMSPNYQSQPSVCQTKTTFHCLHCRPIHRIRYVHWTAPSVVRTGHMATFDLIVGYCKTRQTAIICSVAVIIRKSFGKAFAILNTGIYCSGWWALRGIWMSPLHWNLTLPNMTRSGRTSASQIQLIQKCTLMDGCKQLIEGEIQHGSEDLGCFCL
jgi:hypothetical protein